MPQSIASPMTMDLVRLKSKTRPNSTHGYTTLLKTGPNQKVHLTVHPPPKTDSGYTASDLNVKNQKYISHEYVFSKLCIIRCRYRYRSRNRFDSFFDYDSDYDSRFTDYDIQRTYFTELLLTRRHKGTKRGEKINSIKVFGKGSEKEPLFQKGLSQPEREARRKINLIVFLRGISFLVQI